MSSELCHFPLIRIVEMLMCYVLNLLKSRDLRFLWFAEIHNANILLLNLIVHIFIVHNENNKNDYNSIFFLPTKHILSPFFIKKESICLYHLSALLSTNVLFCDMALVFICGVSVNVSVWM